MADVHRSDEPGRAEPEGSKPEGRLACLEHGFLEQSAGGVCPVCEEEVYRLGDDGDRGFVKQVVRTRRMTRFGKAIGIALASGVVLWAALLFVPGLGDVAIAAGQVGMLLIVGVVYAVVITVLQARLPAPVRALERWATTKERSLRWRLLSGTPPLLVAALVAFSVIVLVLGGPEALLALALRPSEVLAGERLWTLVSSALVHASAGHFVNNAIALLLFGVAVDLRAGRLPCLLLVVVTAAAGGLCETFFGDDPDRTIVGISGAVYGLAGASLVLMPRRRFVLAPMGMVFLVPAFVFVPALVAIYSTVDWIARDDIAVLAHLGGFVAGVVLALPLRRVPPPDDFVAAEERRAERLEELQRSS